MRRLVDEGHNEASPVFNSQCILSVDDREGGHYVVLYYIGEYPAVRVNGYPRDLVQSPRFPSGVPVCPYSYWPLYISIYVVVRAFFSPENRCLSLLL